MNLLLLVQNQSHVEKLLASAPAIHRAGFLNIWAVHSPAIAVKESESAKQFDTEIAELERAEAEAAGRRDYDAAKGYRASRDGKALERAKFIRDAWKAVEVDDRKVAYQSIFFPFMDKLKALEPKIFVKVQQHANHYDSEQWVEMLNSLSGVWFAPFKPGTFVIGWPGAIPGTASVAPTATRAEAPAELATAAVSVATAATRAIVPRKIKPAKATKPVYATREDELMHMKHFGIINACKPYGIVASGRPRADVVKDILAAEAGHVAAV